MIEDDVRTAIDDALARRLDEAARRRANRQALRARKAAARTAGVDARNAAKLARIRKAQNVTEPTTDALRRAIANLGPRERRALRDQSAQAGTRWRDLMPRLAEVWECLADLVSDIEQLDRARRAAEPRDDYVRRAKA